MRRSLSRRRKEPVARRAHLLFLLIGSAILFLAALWLALSGFCYPPQPSLHVLKQLPWLDSAEAGDGSFTSLCSKPASGHEQNRFLVALIFNRVFGSDLFRVSPYECRQWIEYMLYAGVEHVFWYDAAHSNAETVEAYLRPYIHAGLLTYFRFHSLFPGSLSESFHFEQDNSYRHFLANFAQKSKWAIQMDVDEYPFSMSDSNSCFLHQLIQEYEADSPNVTQILLQCMIFAGNPQGDLVNGWVIERYQRRRYETEGVEKGYQSRQKPIYRADLCKGILKDNPHVVWMEDGKTFVANEKRIRMNHYWGARAMGLERDNLETTGMLVHDSSIQLIASRIKQATGLSKREDDTIASLLRWMAWT